MLIKVIKVPKHNRYVVQCKYGVLKQQVSATSLNTIPEAVSQRYLNDFINAPTKKLTLHKTALKESNVRHVVVSYNYRKGCNTNRCVCHKNAKGYTQYYHPEEYDCGNMEERIINRTERPIINIGDLNDDPEAIIDVDNKSDHHKPIITAITTTIIPKRKRAITKSSPKQRKHKQLKATQSSASITGALSAESLRRLTRQPAPSRKVRENNEQIISNNKEDDEENNTNKEVNKVEKYVQTTLS